MDWFKYTEEENREYLLYNYVSHMKKGLSRASFPKKFLWFSQVTVCMPRQNWMERYVKKQTACFPLVYLELVLRAYLQWVPFKNQHLSTGIMQLPQLFLIMLWYFRCSLVTALGKHWLLSGNQYNCSFHEREQWAVLIEKEPGITLCGPAPCLLSHTELPMLPGPSSWAPTAPALQLSLQQLSALQWVS